ncbi:MAG TPA: sugar phosphate isomerase/epimerase family protein, partial [Planctomycetaceae bacterium]
MKLGFVSAILPDLSLREVVAFAREAGYSCVEIMCWPVSKAERRYAGVTHIDVANLTKAHADEIHEVFEGAGIELSGLGYYPNPLSADRDEAQACIKHLQKVIRAAPLLGCNRVNTFIGRDWTKSVDDNWPQFRKVWKPLLALAEQQQVYIGIENCPMLFTRDEWPGGKNLAISPAIWRRMFADIPSPHFGLNLDPSHLVWQQIDYLAPVAEFASRLVHVHAKDARVDRAGLD